MPSTTATSALTGVLQTSILNERGHFCGICKKSFDRRDLRDRHKRRCVKNSTRPQVSRRKSCLACVRSKVRCDLASPACSRCCERGKECLYTATVVLSSNQADIVTDPELKRPLMVVEDLIEASAEIPGGVTTEELLDESLDTDMTITADLGFRQLLDNNELYLSSTDSQGYSTEKGNDTAISSGTLQHDEGHDWGISNTIQDFGGSEEWLRDIELPPGGFMTSQPSWSRKPPGEDLILGSKPTGASTPDLSALDPPFQGGVTTIDNTPTTPQLNTVPKLPHGQPKQIPRLTPFCLPTPTLVSILLDIPTAMLEPQVYPPFVHHLLYPCSSPNIDTVPCAISNAFCFLKAYEVAVGSSLAFIHNVMNIERERLISQSGETRGVVDILAIVHALCMYQIVSFFDSTDPAQILAAEKQNIGFLKVVRRLIQYRKDTATASVGTEVDWQEWKVEETVVRTIHVVHAINVVSMRAIHRRGRYEPLDDEAVDSLPLPCAEEIWKASNSVEWARVRRKLGGAVTMTRGQLVGGGDTADEFVRKYGGGGLMKLILSCIYI